MKTIYFIFVIMGASVLMITSTAYSKEYEEDTEKILIDQNNSSSEILNLDSLISETIQTLKVEKNEFMMRVFLPDNQISIEGLNINEQNILNTETVFIGSNILVNNSDVDQNLTTSEFEKSINETTTTTSLLGWGFSVSNTVTASIPLFVEGSLTKNLEFNFSNSTEYSYSETKLLRSPANTITVPKGKSYKVEIYLEQKKVTGLVSTTVDIVQSVVKLNLSNPQEPGTHFYLSELLYLTEKESFIQSPDDSNAVRISGTGKFTTEYGVNFLVKVFDIESQYDSKLINTVKIPIG